MAARARGKDSATDRKQRASLRQPTVWVYTEGTVTEPQYVDIVRQWRDPSVRLSVHIANDERTHGGTKGPKNSRHSRKPLDLLDQALDKLREEKRKERKERWPKPPTGYRWTTVWCLFDRDDHKGVDDIMRRVDEEWKAEGVDDIRDASLRVAYSHPCFELWRLLHHQDYTSTFGRNCDAAAQRLPFFTTKDQAKIVRTEQIKDGYKLAKQRAQRINAKHAAHVPHSRRDPYTDVWRFVEDGLRVTDY
ncbi:RloB family protein [Streptomyces sp. NPDC050504]|uniref:RloB family protein n=1 Tax=Streptomyces sp. NPDC050504 TaxID=3365618 RepID=UPI003794314D